jgi:hypothetical protein
MSDFLGDDVSWKIAHINEAADLLRDVYETEENDTDVDKALKATWQMLSLASDALEKRR